MKKFIVSLFAICALGSWPIVASAQSNGGQNKPVKTVPKVESGQKGEFKVKPVHGTSSVLEKKATDAQREHANKQTGKQSGGQSGSTGSQSGSTGGSSTGKGSQSK